jgi:two-component system LytT family response regulator
MDRTKVLVVDDEPHARAGMRKLLSTQSDIDIVGEAGDGAAAVAAVRRLQPNLVLLDVQMPEMDGISVAEEIMAPGMPAIVFVTAYDQFAVRAFDVNALDYLVKPFTDERFFQAIARAQAQIGNRQYQDLGRKVLGLLDDVAKGRGTGTSAEREPAHADCITRFLVKRNDRSVVVECSDVDWIEAASYCARIHAGARSYVIRESLNSLERRLDPAKFARAHRSAIVNLARVHELGESANGQLEVVLKNGTEIPLSRSRARAFAAHVRTLKSAD